jgi:hypothetical protein
LFDRMDNNALDIMKKKMFWDDVADYYHDLKWWVLLLLVTLNCPCFRIFCILNNESHMSDTMF